jgi:predicted DNA-binding transcriptional regulator AlpA
MESGIERLLLNDIQLAQILSVSRASVWRLKSQGRLPLPVRIGRSVRWRYSDIKNWVNRLNLNKEKLNVSQ